MKIKYKKFEVFGELCRIVAEQLQKGKIIANFQGKSEFGPRALGNRSIITAPFPASMKDVLNERVKHREGWRPFAPAVLLEDADEYFDIPYNVDNIFPQSTEYMLISANIKTTKDVEKNSAFPG